MTDLPLWLFTFGYGQRLRATSSSGRSEGVGLPLDDHYVRIPADTPELARHIMGVLFGQIWSFGPYDDMAAEAMLAQFPMFEVDISRALAKLADQLELAE